MNSRKFHLHDGRRGAALAVRLTPRASRNEITEIMPDGTVKVRLTASLSDSEGNKSLIIFLADVLGVTPAQIDIIGGVLGNDKLLSILDIDTNEVHQRIQAYLG
ncbi:MAG: DUF167 domain-containing protein [Chloroflexi bacterium]|nr:DUF167 domain-containing protein [Chloroflexota bacterium]